MAQKPIIVLPKALGTITCAGERAEAPASMLAEHNHIGLVFRSNGSAAAFPFIIGDFGAAKDVNFCAVLNANANASSQLNLVLSPTNAFATGYNSALQTIITPATTSLSGLYHWFWDIGSTQTYRYWALLSYNHGGGDFEAAKVVLGMKYQPAYFQSDDWGRGVQDLGDFDVNRRGVPSITDGKILRTLKFTLGWVSEAEYETYVRPIMELCGTRTPIYICLDPEATTYRQGKTYFGWLREPGYATASVRPGFYEQSFELLSMI